MKSAELCNRVKESTGVVMCSTRASEILESQGLTDHIAGTKTIANGRVWKIYDFREHHVEEITTHIRNQKYCHGEQFQRREDPTPEEIRAMTEQFRRDRPRPMEGYSANSATIPMIPRQSMIEAMR